MLVPEETENSVLASVGVGDAISNNNDDDSASETQE